MSPTPDRSHGRRYGRAPVSRGGVGKCFETRRRAGRSDDRQTCERICGLVSGRRDHREFRPRTPSGRSPVQMGRAALAAWAGSIAGGRRSATIEPAGDCGFRKISRQCRPVIAAALPGFRAFSMRPNGVMGRANRTSGAPRVSDRNGFRRHEGESRPASPDEPCKPEIPLRHFGCARRSVGCGLHERRRRSPCW